MRFRLSLPARINIIGNPTDANEGDYATISCAIDLRAWAEIESVQSQIRLIADQTRVSAARILQEVYPLTQTPLPYTGNLDLIKGAINGLRKHSPEFSKKIQESGFLIKTGSDVPRQSGLGGSSLFVLLTLAGLREIYELNRVQHNDYVLAEIAQRVESKELGITCGFADRYVPLFGGLAYLDYRGKLYQTALNEEPYVTYERLDPYAGHLPLVIIYSGIKHNSGYIHKRMRPRFIQEYQNWQLRGGSPPEIVHLMIKTWETAWRGKIALLGGDQQRLGNLMNENHVYVNQMMKICGLEDGAGIVNNLLVEAALQNGALGSKLTGAGGGGSVYALVKPGQENRIIEAWQQKIQAHDLDSARIITPRISTNGLLVESMLD